MFICYQVSRTLAREERNVLVLCDVERALWEFACEIFPESHLTPSSQLINPRNIQGRELFSRCSFGSVVWEIVQEASR